MIHFQSAGASNGIPNKAANWHLLEIEKLQKDLSEFVYDIKELDEAIINMEKTIQELRNAKMLLEMDMMFSFPIDYKNMGIKVYNMEELKAFASHLPKHQNILDHQVTQRNHLAKIIEDIESKIRYHSQQISKLQNSTSFYAIEGMWMINGNGSIISIFKDYTTGQLVGVLVEVKDMYCHRVGDVVWRNISFKERDKFVGMEYTYDDTCNRRSFPFSLIPKGRNLYYNSQYTKMILQKIN